MSTVNPPTPAILQASNHLPLFGQSPSPQDVGTFSWSQIPSFLWQSAEHRQIAAPSDDSLGETHLREDPGEYPATRWAPYLGDFQGKYRGAAPASADHQHIAAPSTTSFGKRRQRKDLGDDPVACGTQSLANSQGTYGVALFTQSNSV
jgi:hypothetical protein